MILPIDVDPSVSKIYHAEAERRGTTALELMASVLAFWPAAQWSVALPDPDPKTVNPPFGAGS